VGHECTGDCDYVESQKWIVEVLAACWAPRGLGRRIVAKVKVAFEVWDDNGESAMRWEQQCSAKTLGPFELLGRAFETAQRDTGTGFQEAVVAFLKGASIQKEDIIEALQRVEERK
jgi:hypothetical protein